MVFDPNNKNVSPMYLGTVHDGKITYRVATMNASDQRSVLSAQPSVVRDPDPPAAPSPYARVGEDGVEYRGPHQPDIPAGRAKIILFGPHAAAVAATLPGASRT